MNPIVQSNLPYKIDLVKLFNKLRIKENSPYQDEIHKLVAEAQAIAKPKGIFKNSTVEMKGEDFVIIDGIKFTSRILRINLGDNSKAFPYVVTCGTELEEWSKQFDDIFLKYCVDTIKEMVLESAKETFFAHIGKEFNIAHAAKMNPGSLPDWPITEQKPLFTLLGNVEELIGVHLTESFLMLPVKSGSGIRFFKEGTYENCQLCRSKNCPGRKAPFSEELWQQYH